MFCIQKKSKTVYLCSNPNRKKIFFCNSMDTDMWKTGSSKNATGKNTTNSKSWKNASIVHYFVLSNHFTDTKFVADTDTGGLEFTVPIPIVSVHLYSQSLCLFLSLSLSLSLTTRVFNHSFPTDSGEPRLRPVYNKNIIIHALRQDSAEAFNHIISVESGKPLQSPSASQGRGRVFGHA